jgi:hypothetical protein
MDVQKSAESEWKTIPPEKSDSGLQKVDAPEFMEKTVAEENAQKTEDKTSSVRPSPEASEADAPFSAEMATDKMSTVSEDKNDAAPAEATKVSPPKEPMDEGKKKNPQVGDSADTDKINKAKKEKESKKDAPADEEKSKRERSPRKKIDISKESW